MSALTILLKLRAYAVASLRDDYTEDDAEHDQLLLESYLHPTVERVKGGKRHVTRHRHPDVGQPRDRKT